MLPTWPRFFLHLGCFCLAIFKPIGLKGRNSGHTCKKASGHLIPSLPKFQFILKNRALQTLYLKRLVQTGLKNSTCQSRLNLPKNHTVNQRATSLKQPTGNKAGQKVSTVINIIRPLFHCYKNDKIYKI